MEPDPTYQADYFDDDSNHDKFIELESTQVHSGTVLFRVSYHESLSRYLTTGLFYLNYDFPLESVPPSILSIPLLGLLLPFGWLTGAEVRVGDVDAKYLDSLPEVALEFKKMFPTMNFSGKIRAHPVKNDSEWRQDSYCLLYSGGVDSTCSLIRNYEKRPSLMTVRGTPDIRLHEEQYWTRVRGRIQPFIKSMGLEAHVVETNAIDMVNLAALKADYKGLVRHGWWEELAHGLFLLGACAPYTFHNQIGSVMIAASYTKKNQEPWGSSPMTDEKVRWGGTRVIHDSYDLSKVEKISQVLVPFMRNRGSPIPLRVCTGKRGARLASNQLNCGQCAKCMAIELSLIVSGVDAGQNGFDISPPTLMVLRQNLEAGWFGPKDYPIPWRFIKENISSTPESVVAGHPGLGEFLDWLADWDERPTKKRRRYADKVAPPGSRRRDFASAILGKKGKLEPGVMNADVGQHA
ncbi:MAG: hypothetical protein OK438_00900 [Thaumarchaeota archaeon]|nr:hypothetical protein [Nitrososphaerota archaeon]